MILIITNKLDLHADAVIHHLRNRGGEFVRFNTEDFPRKITFSWQMSRTTSTGLVQLPSGHTISLSEIHSCWYRRPEPPEIDSALTTEQAREFAEKEAKASLDGLWIYLGSCFWINYPPKLRQAESKIFNLNLAVDVGLAVPRTLVTNIPQEARNFFDECDGNVVSKVIGKSQVVSLEDTYFIYTHRVLPQDVERMESVAYAPTLVQEYVPKKVELRVTVVGSKVFSCEIHSQDSKKTLDDWRHYDLENVKHTIHQLPRSVELMLLKMMQKLSLNFAAFDLVLTPDNHYVFLELNPNGQWLWIEKLTGLPISQAIADLLISRGEGLPNTA